MKIKKRVGVFFIIFLSGNFIANLHDKEIIFSKKEEQTQNRFKLKKVKTMLYQVKKNIKPSGLKGISDTQIEDHWKLYEGYVKQVNNLNQELKTLDVTSLIYADRRRRYGFEYNGMVLHEYYFENLKSKNLKLSEGKLKKAIEETWGSFEKWKEDFVAAGKTRGIGWVILYCDPITKKLGNYFISGHSDGNIAGYTPILVMDVWEHAYMVDHKAGGRGEYIKAFFENINWDVVEKRFN